jgi:hypothetical protein
MKDSSGKSCGDAGRFPILFEISNRASFALFAFREENPRGDDALSVANT